MEEAKTKNVTRWFVILLVLVAVTLIGTTKVQACECNTEDSMMIEFENVDGCSVSALDIDCNATVLEAKEALASFLNEGVSPEEIFLVYDEDPCGEYKELLDDSVRLVEYSVEDGDTLYYAISPLAMGEILESGSEFDFGLGERARVSYIGYDQYENKFCYVIDTL